MNTSVLMYGEPAEVANELCSCNEPENVLHVDLIAALGNALNRIANLEGVSMINDTKSLTVIQRLKAAERYYRKHDPRFADGLKHAIQICAADGWKHIAPAWHRKETK